MAVPYDMFTNGFLRKITEYTFVQMDDVTRGEIVDGYMKTACAAFNKVCKYDLTAFDDEARVFNIDVKDEDMDELVEIITEGMLVQWMKPFVYRQENLESILNTRDFTTYSPAELLMRIGNAYTKVQKDYTNMIREYSYNHGDLTDLHL